MATALRGIVIGDTGTHKKLESSDAVTTRHKALPYLYDCSPMSANSPATK